MIVEEAPPQVASLDYIDIGVIVIYMAAMLGIGAYFMRRQTTAKEYLLAGRGVGFFAIGLSLLASMNSAVDYVIGPTQIIQYGFLNLVMILPVFTSFPFVFKYFLPFYQRLRLYNCYEYLEHRFDVRVRLTATLLFILWRISWMGTTIYLPAYVLNKVMGLNIFYTILVLGVVTTVYTTMGGVRGVIWTDVTQSFIMFGGLVVAVWLVVRQIPGGVAEVWAVAKNSSFMRFTEDIPEMATATSLWEKVSLYFHCNVTFWNILVVGTLGKLTHYGSDHVMVQRYLAAKSIRDSKNGFVINSVAYVIYSLLFIALGMGLFAFSKLNTYPAGWDPDYVFPYFIRQHFPVVMTGLIIAAIYSAAQSSVSSGITAITAAVFSDFYLRLFRGQVSVDESVSEEVQRHHVWFSRLCALGLGIVVTAFACVVQELHAREGLVELFNKITGPFGGLIIPLFVLGMFSRRVRSFGVCVGVLCGLAVSYYWGFATELGFGWIGCAAFVVTVVVAYVISLFEKEPPEEKQGWLWKSVMARPESTNASSGAGRT